MVRKFFTDMFVTIIQKPYAYPVDIMSALQIPLYLCGRGRELCSRYLLSSFSFNEQALRNMYVCILF